MSTCATLFALASAISNALALASASDLVAISSILLFWYASLAACASAIALESASAAASASDLFAISSILLFWYASFAAWA